MVATDDGLCAASQAAAVAVAPRFVAPLCPVEEWDTRHSASCLRFLGSVLYSIA